MRMADIFDTAWVDRLPAEQIPKTLNQLAAVQSRLAARLAMVPARSAAYDDALVDAPALAKRLGVPESHVRTLQRSGTIPFIKIGKYIRFSLASVEAALAEAKS
jgi:excisionase family DNA binding protein